MRLSIAVRRASALASRPAVTWASCWVDDSSMAPWRVLMCDTCSTNSRPTFSIATCVSCRLAATLARNLLGLAGRRLAQQIFHAVVGLFHGGDQIVCVGVEVVVALEAHEDEPPASREYDQDTQHDGKEQGDSSNGILVRLLAYQTFLVCLFPRLCANIHRRQGARMAVDFNYVITRRR